MSSPRDPSPRTAPLGAWWTTGGVVAGVVLAALLLGPFPLPALPSGVMAPGPLASFAPFLAALLFAAACGAFAVAFDWLVRHAAMGPTASTSAWFAVFLLPGPSSPHLWLVLPCAAFVHALALVERGRVALALPLLVLAQIWLHPFVGLAPWLAALVARLAARGRVGALPLVGLALGPPAALVAWAVAQGDALPTTLASSATFLLGRPPHLAWPPLFSVPAVHALATAAGLLACLRWPRLAPPSFRVLAGWAALLCMPGLGLAAGADARLAVGFALAPALLLATLGQRFPVLLVPLSVAAGWMWFS
jgi:hypothetical protein